METEAYNGGNLFEVASRRLNDASQWWRIAQANGLDDFLLVGSGTLNIPAADAAVEGYGLPPQED